MLINDDNPNFVDILHVSGDYPDPINAHKTPVIQRLVRGTWDDFRHHVISINRKNPTITGLVSSISNGALCSKFLSDPVIFEDGLAYHYQAPPLGLLHETILKHLGEDLGKRSTSTPLPRAIIGHKLTIEGIIAQRAAKILGIPFAITIQGNTDLKILKARPDLRSLFRSVFHEAAVVFVFAPWALKQTEGVLGNRTGPTHLLPCPTDLDIIQNAVEPGVHFLSIFHLKGYKTKNLRRICEANAKLVYDGTSSPFVIAGGGTQKEREQCDRLAQGSGVELIGAKNRDEIQALLKQSIAYVMPSLRESFGLVFTEALFAGIPIIYPAGSAVDGYFDGLPFAIRVNSRDSSSISDGMLYAKSNEARLKEELQQWAAAGGLDRFTRSEIFRVFKEGCQQLIV